MALLAAFERFVAVGIRRRVVVLLYLLPFFATFAFAQFEPPTVPSGSTSGAITWNVKVLEDNLTKDRVGQCKWNLQFKTDGTEWANSLSFQNKDTYYPFPLHNPPQLGDQRVEVITEGHINQPQHVNGRLTYKRGPQSVDFYFVMPSYEALSVTHTYTWDPFRNSWQPATGTVQTNYAHTVYCGPQRVPNQKVTVNQTYVSGGINQNATGVGLSNVVLELKVPVAFLSYQWAFNVPLK